MMNYQMEIEIDKEAKKRYLNSENFKKQLQMFKKQLRDIHYDFLHLTNEQKEMLLNKQCEQLAIENMPPGTLGAYRGNIFNEKVFNQIKESFPSLEVKREVDVSGMKERVDIVVSGFEKQLIIYNQLDFFNGGHQRNRRNYYLSPDFSKNVKPNQKVIFVVLREPKSKTEKKELKRHHNVFYPDTLNECIRDYFEPINNKIVTFLESKYSNTKKESNKKTFSDWIDMVKKLDRNVTIQDFEEDNSTTFYQELQKQFEGKS